VATYALLFRYAIVFQLDVPVRDRCTAYLLIAAPPVLDGLSHASLTLVLRGVAVGERGLVGLVTARVRCTELDAGERSRATGTPLGAAVRAAPAPASAPLTIPTLKATVPATAALTARRARRLRFMGLALLFVESPRGTRSNEHDEQRSIRPE
jgi:hypothetical protein